MSWWERNGFSVAQILVKDPVLFKKWWKLANELNIKEPDLQTLRNVFNSNGDPTEFINQIITTWLSKEINENRTLVYLIQVLETGSFIKVAEELADLYGLDGNVNEREPLLHPSLSTRENGPDNLIEAVVMSSHAPSSLTISNSGQNLNAVRMENQRTPNQPITYQHQPDNTHMPVTGDLSPNMDYKARSNIAEQTHHDFSSVNPSGKSSIFRKFGFLILFLALILAIVIGLYSFGYFDYLNNERAEWIGLDKPINNFVGRESEIKLIANHFEKWHPPVDGMVALFIVGPMSVGKSELVRIWAQQLYDKNKVNIIGVNGGNLQTEVRTIMKRSNKPCSHLFDINCVIGNSEGRDMTKKSVIIFDGIDGEKSMKDMDLIFKSSTKLQPKDIPFIIVTSRDTKITSSEKLANLLSYTKPISLELIEYGSVTNILELDAKPWFLNIIDHKLSSSETESLNFILDALSKQDTIQDRSSVDLATTFSFLVLLSQPVIKNVNTRDLVEFWPLLMNYSITPENWQQIITFFTEDNSPLIVDANDADVLDCAPVLSALSNRFLHYKLIRHLLQTTFDVESTEASIIRWLLKPIFKLLEIDYAYNTRDCNEGIIEIGRRLLPESFKWPELVKYFKNQLPYIPNLNSPCNIWELNTLETAFRVYDKVFGFNDMSTLHISARLAYNYYSGGNYPDCGNLYLKLHNGVKEIYGVVSDLSLDYGLQALRCFKKAGSTEKAFQLAIEIIETCKAENCTHRLNSNFTWKYTLDISINRTDVSLIF